MATLQYIFIALYFFALALGPLIYGLMFCYRTTIIQNWDELRSHPVIGVFLIFTTAWLFLVWYGVFIIIPTAQKIIAGG